MPRHLHTSTHPRIDQPFLIIDKTGVIASSLSRSIHDKFVTVVVSKDTPPAHPNVVHIPYHTIPVLPNNLYSYFVLVYQGERELLSSLQSIAEQAQVNKAPVLFLLQYHDVTASIIDTVLRVYDHAIVVVYGDLYGKDVHTPSPLLELLSQAKHRGQITLPNSGLLESYPVYLPDLIQGISQICFGTGPKQRVVLLLPQHAYSSFSLARAIQHEYPDVQIDLAHKSSESPKLLIPKEGVYALQETSLEETIPLLDIPEEGSFKQTPKRQKRKILFPKVSLLPAFGIIAILILFFVLPFLIGGIGGVRALRNLQSGKIDRAVADTSFSLPFLTLAVKEGSVMSHILPTQRIITLNSTLRVMTDGLMQLHDSLDAATLLSQGLSGKRTLSQSDFDGTIATLSQSALFYEKLEADHTVPAFVAGKSKEIDSAIDTFLALRPMLSGFMGYSGRRTYLVLFQNNMELRPGGGFIGSYGLLTIDKGKIGAFTIHDVYDADGQLKGHIDPPFALSRYLGASHWYLRDSNADVNGEVNTSEALTFLKLETGESADGVIGIDVTFLGNLLGVTGPLRLPDYNETVTKQNFYLLTEEHAQKNFFPGSTQKKDFLREVATQLQSQLLHPTQSELFPLVSELLRGIQTKHILVDSTMPSEQSLLSLNDINNSLQDNRPHDAAHVNDFLGIREANVGQNKVNYYLNRTLSQKSVLGNDGTLTDTATVTYHNASLLTSSFGGTYKAYVSFVVPSGASVTGVLVNGVSVPYQDAITDTAVYKAEGFVPPLAREIEAREEDRKTIFGTYIEVPPLTTFSLSLQYSLPTTVPLSKNILYSLMVSKQPGTDSDPFSLALSLPAGQVVSKDQGLTQRGSTILYNGILTTDKTLSVQLAE